MELMRRETERKRELLRQGVPEDDPRVTGPGMMQGPTEEDMKGDRWQKHVERKVIDKEFDRQWGKFEERLYDWAVLGKSESDFRESW